MSAGLRAGQVAEAVGVNVETLRYYERRGIIAEPDRSPGGHHRGGRHGTGLLARTDAKLAEVEQRIADLQVIRASLLAARDAGCDDLVQCAESDCCPIPFAQIGRLAAAGVAAVD